MGTWLEGAEWGFGIFIGWGIVGEVRLPVDTELTAGVILVDPVKGGLFNLEVAVTDGDFWTVVGRLTNPSKKK